MAIKSHTSLQLHTLRSKTAGGNPGACHNIVEESVGLHVFL